MGAAGERVPELGYTASARVAEMIAGLGRTEDVRFSPGNHRLAVAGFNAQRILVLDVEVSAGGSGAPSVALTGGLDLACPAFRRPHGLDFLDDETLVVTSRAAGVAVVPLPPGDPHVPVCEQQPLHAWDASQDRSLDAPGSVAALPLPGDARELLVCNNRGNRVSRHVLTPPGQGAALLESGTLVARHLDIPDGVAVSPDGRWVAVSNHNHHNVLLYDRSAPLDAQSEPHGILRGVVYPHGLRFSPDGRHLIVADAGAPAVHVFTEGPHGWHGLHETTPCVVMLEETFARGNSNPQEGGPKGLDIDRSGKVLVVTSEHQPLAFFELRCVLEHAGASHALGLRNELHLVEERHALRTHLAEARRVIETMKGSRSWRSTKLLRGLERWLGGEKTGAG